MEMCVNEVLIVLLNLRKIKTVGTTINNANWSKRKNTKKNNNKKKLKKPEN